MFIIVSIAAFYFWNNSDNDTSSNFNAYKVHPDPRAQQEGGGPDYYEGVCLEKTNFTTRDDILSIDRDDLKYFAGTEETFNPKLASLKNSLEKSFGSEIELVGIDYSRTRGPNLISIITDSEYWYSLADEDKYDSRA